MESYYSEILPIGRLHFELAATHARLGDYENVYRNLDIACESIKAFDQRPEIQNFSSLLLGTVELKRMDFETADSRNQNHCEISETDFSLYPHIRIQHV